MLLLLPLLLLVHHQEVVSGLRRGPERSIGEIYPPFCSFDRKYSKEKYSLYPRVRVHEIFEI